MYWSAFTVYNTIVSKAIPKRVELWIVNNYVNVNTLSNTFLAGWNGAFSDERNIYLVC